MRINDKVNEIEIYLEEFISILPKTFEEYLGIKEKVACERYFEKIIEAVVDLAFLIIKEKDLEKPDDDNIAFDILYENNIISKKICENLKDAKGMRNLITHQYGFVDNKIIFHAITEEFESDVKDFIQEINTNLIKK
jgi:uncharacterized protein YutE (UPF0331/DUF86 family)